MSWRGWGGAAAGALVLACGRVGYDPAGAADGGTIDAPVAIDAAPPRPLCQELPQLVGPPLIDGVLEEGLTALAVEPAGWKGAGVGPPDGNLAAAAIGWWPGGLYVHLDVTDPDRLPPPASDYTWCGDGVELYVDSDGALVAAPDYDPAGTRQLVMVAPADDSAPVARGEIYRRGALLGDWTGSFTAVPRSGGYTAEAIVAAADLALDAWAPAAGQRVGIDLAINVSSADGTTAEVDCPTGTRLGQYFLQVDAADTSDCEGHPYCDAAAFCTPTLAP